MKYYCLGYAISLMKTTYSDKWYENAPIIGTPIFSRLPVTQSRMRSLFESTDKIIMCRTLEDANALRHARLPAISPSFADRLRISDYPIYEVELDDDIDVNFIKFVDATNDELKDILSHEKYLEVMLQNDRSKIPNIEICHANKSELNPRLITCHYLSPVNGREEVEEESRCTIL